MRHRGVTPPSVIVLDLNMPGARGQQVLAFIGLNLALRDVPVVVLTSSALAGEVQECLRLGAVEVVTKPLTFEGLVQVAKRVFARIPPRHAVPGAA